MSRTQLIQLVEKYSNMSFKDHPFNRPNSHESILWTAIRHEQTRKIIALIFNKDGKLLIDLKLDPKNGELACQYKSVTPGYHMNKTYWNTVYVNHTEVSKSGLISMIKESYKLTY